MKIYIESRNISELLNKWNLTPSTLVDLIYTDIVEDTKKNKAISVAIDNDFSSADEINKNISHIKSSIKSEILPEIYKYYNRHEDEDPRNYESFILKNTTYKNLLHSFNNEFSSYLISEER